MAGRSAPGARAGAAPGHGSMSAVPDTRGGTRPPEPLAVSAPVPTAARAEPAVALSGATARLGGRTIWSGVDVQVREGEFVAVLGSNGAGKSTLMKAILGLIPLAAGSVSVLGEPPGRRNREIGYLPQRRSFDPSTRVRGIDLVRLGLDGDRSGPPLALGSAARARRLDAPPR